MVLYFVAKSKTIATTLIQQSSSQTTGDGVIENIRLKTKPKFIFIFGSRHLNQNIV